MLATHRRAISLASLALVASGASAAPIVNGGFETGDFSGWAGNGWAVVDSSVGSPMLGGKYSALIVSEGGCRSDLSDFWGCTTPPIPTQPIQDGPLANPFPAKLPLQLPRPHAFLRPAQPNRPRRTGKVR